MAITPKELKIKATLDSQGLQKQLEDLKKQLGAELSLGGIGANEFKALSKDMAQIFSKEIQSVLGKIKNINTTAIGKRGSNESAEMKELYDSQRGKYVKLKQGEIYDPQFSKKFKNEADLAKFLEVQSQKRTEKELKSRKKAEEEVAKERERLERGYEPMRKRMAELRQKAATSYLGEKGIVSEAGENPKGKGPAIMGALKAAGSLGAAGLAATMGVIDIQRTYTERQFRALRDVASGKQIEGIARQAGRQSTGAQLAGGIGGALAGAGSGAAMGAYAGSFFGPGGTIIGGALGGLGGGIYGGLKGSAAVSNMWGELKAEQIGPISDAYEKARSVNPLRMQAYAGGGLFGGALNNLQTQGAQQGYMPEETLRQTIEGRRYIGAKGALENLGQAQQIERTTGTGTEQQFQAAETFAGAGRIGMGAGFQKQIEVLKKGVAAGLDVSKTSQFLRATSDFVSSNAGMGNIDTSDISTRLAMAVKASAGGQEATQMDIQRAMQREQMVRQESTAEEGLAGIGNITAIQQALGDKATPEAMLALMRTSSTATPEDTSDIIQKTTNLPKEEADKIAQQLSNLKKTNLQRGASTATGDNTGMGFALAGRETGLSMEQYLGRTNIEAGMQTQGALDIKGAEQTMAAIGQGVGATKEMGLAKSEATFANQQVIAGVDVFDKAMQFTAQQANALAEALAKAKTQLEGYSHAIKVSSR